jgi:hypothetical protein
MGIFWATLVIALAAATAIRTVILSIRHQNQELPLLEGRDLAQGGADRPK